MLNDIRRVIRAVKAHLRKRILSVIAQCLQLLTANGIFFRFRTNRLGILRLLILLCHAFLLLYM